MNQQFEIFMNDFKANHGPLAHRDLTAFVNKFETMVDSSMRRNIRINQLDPLNKQLNDARIELSGLCVENEKLKSKIAYLEKVKGMSNLIGTVV